MTIHPKDKQRCLAYLASLKSLPEFLPFCAHFADRFGVEAGYSDFGVIAKHNVDIYTIQKALKTNKYHSLPQFYSDLKQLLQNLLLYLFEDDELSVLARKYLNLIKEQEKQHLATQEVDAQAQLRKEREGTHTNKQHRESKDQARYPNPESVLPSGMVPDYASLPMNSGMVPGAKRATLLQKLEMVYLLRSHEDNFTQIQNIGNTYKIGKTVEDEYVIKLEGVSWLQLLKKMGDR